MISSMALSQTEGIFFFYNKYPISIIDIFLNTPNIHNALNGTICSESFDIHVYGLDEIYIVHTCSVKSMKSRIKYVPLMGTIY